MIGSLFVAIALPLLGSGTRVDVAAASVTQVEAGRRPLVFDEPSRPAIDAVTSLPLGIRALSLRTSLQFVYTPQLELQIPNAARTYRPLQMHQLSALYSSRLTQRTEMTAGFLGRAGETSYGSLQNYFATGSSTTSDSFTRFATASSYVGTRTQTSRRNSLGWVLTGGYSAPLKGPSDESADTASTLPTSYDLSLALQDTYTLSRTDGLGFTVRAGYVDVLRSPNSQSQDQVLAASDVSWFRRLSPSSDFTLTGGAAVLYGMDTERLEMAPTASGSHSVTWRGIGGIWTATTRLETQPFLDRVSATYRPRGTAQFNLGGSIGRPWLVEFYASGSMSLVEEPIRPATYESSAGAGQTTTYSFSSRGRLSWGVRAGIRLPHHSEVESLKPQDDLAAFVGFRWNIGTDRQYGSWL